MEEVKLAATGPGTQMTKIKSDNRIKFKPGAPDVGELIAESGRLDRLGVSLGQFSGSSGLGIAMLFFECVRQRSRR